MPHLEKMLTTVYGADANCANFELTKGTMQPDGSFKIGGNLRLFRSQEDFEAGKKEMDNFTFEYVMTGEEFLQVALSIFEAIQEAVPDPTTGEETNLLHGKIGRVGFQDAVLVL